MVFDVFAFEAYHGGLDIFHPTTNWMMVGGRWNRLAARRWVEDRSITEDPPTRETLATRGLEEPFFQLCCCVSFVFWWEIGFGIKYILLMYLEYHTVVVLY